MGVLVLGVMYTGLVFLRGWPEYVRGWPTTRLAFFAPPGGQLPDDGLFGFPARDGWKSAERLFAQGVLQGSFDSNQELFTTGWYLRGQFRCQRDPDYFLLATGASPLFIPPGYQLAATVETDGRRTLEIYSRKPVASPPIVVDAAALAPAYDAAPVPFFPLRRLLSGVVPQFEQTTAWRDGFALRGFDLDRTVLDGDAVAFLTLYWRADTDLPDTLGPVVELRDAGGRVVAEAEQFCGGVPAELWQQTYVNDTPFRIAANTLAPGRYTLHVGVRDVVTESYVPLADGSATIQLATLTVRSGS